MMLIIDQLMNIWDGRLIDFCIQFIKDIIILYIGFDKKFWWYWKEKDALNLIIHWVFIYYINVNVKFM